jgi:hypothetical protein
MFATRSDMFSGRKELGGETTRDESEHRGDHRQSATFSRVAFGINPAGVIAGEYADASFVFHGFVRAANGTITTFDAPGAGTGPGQGTEAFGINYAGTIEGVLRRLEQCVSWLRARCERRYHHIRSTGCGHRSRLGPPVLRGRHHRRRRDHRSLQ